MHVCSQISFRGPGIDTDGPTSDHNGGAAPDRVVSDRTSLITHFDNPDVNVIVADFVEEYSHCEVCMCQLPSGVTVCDSCYAEHADDNRSQQQPATAALDDDPRPFEAAFELKRFRASSKTPAEKYKEVNVLLSQAKHNAKMQWSAHVAQQSVANRARSRSPSLRRSVSVPASSREHIWDKVHHTHSRWLVGGIVFCRHCGYWMTTGIQKLSQPCPRAPRNHCVLMQKKRMLNGQHPDYRARKWPSGYPASVLMRPRPLDTG